MLEPQQGGTYEQFLGLARTAEAAGFDGVFRSDHLVTIGGAPRDCLEAWTVLAALARDTSHVRLGTLVSPMTFRHPALLAREAVTVDQLSDGRVELGVGTGWHEPEHTVMGIPFPPMAERVARLEEGMEVITALLRGNVVDHTGTYYTLSSAVMLPRPVQSHLPVILGGHGGPRSAALAARLADEYNTTTGTADDVRGIIARVRGACEREGRDPATLRMSWMGTCIVAADAGELHRRAADFAAMMGAGEEDGAAVAEQLRDHGIVGTYDAAAASMRAYFDAGCDRLYLRVLNLDDPEMLLEIADEVAAQVPEPSAVPSVDSAKALT